MVSFWSEYHDGKDKEKRAEKRVVEEILPMTGQNVTGRCAPQARDIQVVREPGHNLFRR
jgi:hypothetical protein